MNSRVARRHVQRRSFRWLNLLVILAVLLFSINIGAQLQEYFALQSEINHYQDQLAFVEAEYEKQNHGQPVVRHGVGDKEEG